MSRKCWLMVALWLSAGLVGSGSADARLWKPKDKPAFNGDFQDVEGDNVRIKTLSGVETVPYLELSRADKAEVKSKLQRQGQRDVVTRLNQLEGRKTTDNGDAASESEESGNDTKTPPSIGNPFVGSAGSDGAAAKSTPATARVWTDLNRNQLTAEFVERKGVNVDLRVDGQIATYPISAFSAADQQWLMRQPDANAPSQPSSPGAGFPGMPSAPGGYPGAPPAGYPGAGGPGAGYPGASSGPPGGDPGGGYPSGAAGAPGGYSGASAPGGYPGASSEPGTSGYPGAGYPGGEAPGGYRGAGGSGPGFPGGGYPGAGSPGGSDPGKPPGNIGGPPAGYPGGGVDSGSGMPSTGFPGSAGGSPSFGPGPGMTSPGSIPNTGQPNIPDFAPMSMPETQPPDISVPHVEEVWKCDNCGAEFTAADGIKEGDDCPKCSGGYRFSRGSVRGIVGLIALVLAGIGWMIKKVTGKA
jgi:hypothetical protein